LTVLGDLGLVFITKVFPDHMLTKHQLQLVGKVSPQWPTATAKFSNLCNCNWKSSCYQLQSSCSSGFLQFLQLDLKTLVALTGLTIAEYFRDEEGQDMLLFIDNIFHFTQAGSKVSALLGHIPSAIAINLPSPLIWVACISANLILAIFTNKNSGEGVSPLPRRVPLHQCMLRLV
jgi:hypothetical protein